MQSIHPLWHHNNESDINWMDMERGQLWQVTSEHIALIPFSNSSFEKLLFHVLFLLITATAATVM